MAKGKIEINVQLCKCCGFCVEACPLKIIGITDSVNQKGYQYVASLDPEKCTGCAACATMCPEAAIEVYR